MYTPTLITLIAHDNFSLVKEEGVKTHKTLRAEAVSSERWYKGSPVTSSNMVAA